MNVAIDKLIGVEIEFGNYLCERGYDQHDDPSISSATMLFEAHKALFGTTEENKDGCKIGIGEFGTHKFRCYVDHAHFEISTPLTADAADLVIWQRRALQLAKCCKKRAEQRSKGLRIHCATTNRCGSAWGFHINLLISRKTFDYWRDRQWNPLFKAWVPFLVTSPVLFGTGKVGAENSRPAACYQLSQRADYIDELVALETVSSKSLINERDEPLADPLRYARFHISAAFDLNLCEFATWLKCGTAQLVLGLVEAGARLPNLQLKDPLGSLSTVSRDLDMSSQLELTDGSSRSAIDIQEELAFGANRFIDAGLIDEEVVPEAKAIVNAWIVTLIQLRRREYKVLTRRLDWITKKHALDAWRRQLNASWSDPRLIELDLRYGEICGGWFEKLECSHLVDRLEDFLPGSMKRWPATSQRDEARKKIIAKFGKSVVAVDWQHVCINVGSGNRSCVFKIRLDDPLDAVQILKAVGRATTARELVKILPEQYYSRVECSTTRDLIHSQPIFSEEWL